MPLENKISERVAIKYLSISSFSSSSIGKLARENAFVLLFICLKLTIERSGTTAAKVGEWLVIIRA